MKSFSTRGETIPSSPIRKLAPMAAKAAAEGIKIYHLNIGQPDIKTPACATEALKNFQQEVLEYSPSQGIKSLRTKMVGYYAEYGYYKSYSAAGRFSSTHTSPLVAGKTF